MSHGTLQAVVVTLVCPYRVTVGPEAAVVTFASCLPPTIAQHAVQLRSSLQRARIILLPQCQK